MNIDATTSELIAEFKAKGGKIQHIPSGRTPNKSKTANTWYNEYKSR